MKIYLFAFIVIVSLIWFLVIVVLAYDCWKDSELRTDLREWKKNRRRRNDL